MLVPRNRLLLWVALSLPFAGMGFMLPEAILFSVIFLGGLAILAILDATMAPAQLRGIQISMPDIIRLSKEREGNVPLTITHSQKEQILHLGLPFPEEISSSQETLETCLSKNTSRSLIQWPCTPKKRGNYRLQHCYVETLSPMGFWNVRARVNAPTEIRVYPNLADDRKHLSALFLNRGTFGIHSQRMIGQGREFEELRDYIPGDGYDQIDWKATAKRGHPITKIFQIERTQEVYVILDSSRLSGREINGKSSLERFINAALVLGLVTEQQGDLFGLVTFSDHVRGFVRARGGKNHFNTCRDTLYTLHPETVTPNFSEVCSFIRTRLRRRALLIFLTDLDDPVLTDNLSRHMELICRQHLVVVSSIRSPKALPLFDDSPVETLDGVYQRLGGHLLWQHLRELRTKLQRQGVRMLLLNDEKLSAQVVTQYLSIKRRQLL